jgi:hypothetical protein
VTVSDQPGGMRSLLGSLVDSIRRRRYASLIRRSGLFQAGAYLEQCLDDAGARRSPLNHFLARGAALGFDPNPFFDVSYYLERNAGVAGGGKNPLVHYIRYGAAEGRPTSPRFDTAFYTARHPEAAAQGVNPLAHFLRSGVREGLAGVPARPRWQWGLARIPPAVLEERDEPRIPRPPRPPQENLDAGAGSRPSRSARVLGRVLVVGIYLCDRENTAEHVVAELGRSRAWTVEQRWLALGRSPVPAALASVTVARERRGPKFQLLNQLLATDLGPYEFLVVSDDDVGLPSHFLDRYLEVVRAHDLSLAQPARTHRSYVDHPIVEQLDGLTARRTRYVEVGPVFTIRRDAMPLLVPFDEEAPMGWGHDLVWPVKLEASGLRMGIVDAVPVEHSLRKPVSFYGYADADRAMERYLAARPHLSRAEAFTVLEAYP